jgi:hypothetical protein
MDEQVAQLAKGRGPTAEDIIRKEVLASTPEDLQQRARIQQELAYRLSQPFQDDPALQAKARQMAVLTPEQQAEVAAQAEATTEAIFMPVAKRLLQLHGLDPATAAPDAVRAALAAPLTPQQQQVLQQEYEAVSRAVLQPMVTQVLQDAGMESELDSSEEVWRRAEQQLRDWDLEPAAAHPAAVAVPAALLGSLVTIAVTQLIGWFRRRRQRRQQQQQQQEGVLEDLSEGVEA